MATTIAKFNNATKLIAGELNITTATVKVALVTSQYAYTGETEAWSDISPYEVSASDGYEIGGNTIATLTLSQVSGVCKLTAGNVTFTGLVSIFRAGVVYAIGTFNGIINPVLFYILFEDAPADRESAGTDFIIKWNNNGILVI